MSLFFIIKLSSYIYLLTSILIPTQLINLTAQFLSLVLVQPLAYSDILPHVTKCIVLLARFVVLYTILGGNAIYSLLKKEERETNPIIIKKSKDAPTINKATPADDVSLLHSSAADTKLKLNTAEERTEETTVKAIIKNDEESTIKSNNNNNTPNPLHPPLPPAQENLTPVSSEKIDAIEIEDNSVDAKNNKGTQQLVEPLNDTNKETNQFNLDEEIKSKSSPIPIKNSNGDGMTEGKPSAVKKTLAQDQLMINDSIPNTNNHVISADSDKDEKITEAVVPSLTTDNLLEEEELISTTTTSATVTPPAEPILSVDSTNERFYNNIIKKDSDIKSFSENVKNIFDGPPTTTPLPDQKHDSFVLPLSLDTNNYHSDKNDDIKINNDKQSIIPLQSSIEEMMSTATPALTPQAGSASSRRSSTASFNTSSLANKSRLQSALQKLSGPRQTTNSQQQQQQQQTTESVVMNPSHSSTSISNKSKSRFSSLRLTRKKSSGSIRNQPPQQQEEKHQHPELDVEVKPSTSSRLNNKLKKTTKRFSKLFTPST